MALQKPAQHAVLAKLRSQLKRLNATLDRCVVERTAELSDANDHLRAIMDTAVAGIITIDEKGQIESLNTAAEKMFGYRNDELLGRRINLLMTSPDRELHQTYIHRYLRHRQKRLAGESREVLGLRKDGRRLALEISVSEFTHGGRRRFVGMLRDISIRKELERDILRVTEHERQRIGRELHDDLCQRLAAIEFLTQSLAEDLAAKSKSNSRRAAKIGELIREANSSTRELSHGLTPMHLADDGLPGSLEELASRTRSVFRKNCRFHCTCRVRLDNPDIEFHLYRIAQEAVSNAVKHSRARNISIRLKTNPHGLELEVADDGVGIPGIARQSQGMGLRVMRYRAGLIHASLTIRRRSAGGTSVRCAVGTPSEIPAAGARS